MTEPLEIRPCFAYGPDGQQCDMPGGHPGGHAITTTWSDAEALTPAQMMAKMKAEMMAELRQGLTEPGTAAVIAVEAQPADMVVKKVRDDGIVVTNAPAATEVVWDDNGCVACDHPKGLHANGVGACSAPGFADGDKCGCLRAV